MTGGSIADQNNRESSDASTFKKRTRITAYQRVQLESKFMSSAYISKSDQEQLSMELRLPCKTVQAWFKNRRYRWRKSGSPDKQGSSPGEQQMKLSSGQTSGLCYLPSVTTNTSSTNSANQTPSLYINSMVPNHSYNSHGFSNHSNHGYNSNGYTGLGYGSHDGPFSQMNTNYPAANFLTGHRPLGF
ncbi:retinal homeobox protein Rx1-like [Actinia tenebrosa]|uniref:Retinal homeobox protein Rx1-like n=1 Tax=Actinia tenebrosa TaxID=6105 RepID=A0A6P8J1Q3_ACTTE|nr:retinal homeobox protein Rx1-like [Actinia tenebrosa]